MSTKPRSSSAAHPDSHSEAGSAPMKENSATHGSVASPSAPATRTELSVSSPSRPVILVLARTLDAFVPFDAVDEVAGHARVQVGSADDDGDRAARLGEEHRGLAGRVAAADDDDGGLGALAGFHRGGRVVHALALELGEPVDVESAVAGAGGDDHGAPGDLGSVGEADDEVSRPARAVRSPRTGR